MQLLISVTRWMAVVVAALIAAAPAHAEPRIVTAGPDGPARADRIVSLNVTAVGSAGVRVTFPDLRGAFAESACRIPARRPARSASRPRRAPERPPASFAVPYLPGWQGPHLLEVAVTGRGCHAARPLTSRATVPVDVGDGGSADDRPPRDAPGRPAGTGCPGADLPPAPRDMRALRLAVACLVNLERRGRGLAVLRAGERLRLVASRQVHAMRRDGFFGHAGPSTAGLAARLRGAGVAPAGAAELLTAATGALPTPRRVVAAWMAADPMRRVLLDPSMRRVGVAVLGVVANPMNHPGATFAAVLAPRR